MAVLVTPHNEEQEKALFAFLDSLNYEYQNTEEYLLTPEQQEEILRRDRDYREGKTTTRTWDDIKSDLEKIYR